VRASRRLAERGRVGATAGGDDGARAGGSARLALVPGLAALYFVAGKLGLSLAFVHASASAVWPPTGIALAALLLLGARVWPAIFAGAFLVNATTAGNLLTSLGIATGNTLEAITGAFLVARFAGGRHAFDQPRDVFKFVILAGVVATAISATLGVASLSLAGFAPWPEYGRIWLTWWLGDAGGALIVAPAAILWLANPRPGWNRAQLPEAVILALLVLLVTAGVFGGLLPPPWRASGFLCLPLVIWTAFRFGRRETATLVLVLCSIAIWSTVRGLGPFVRGSENESLLLLQGFMGVVALTGLSLAAVVFQHRRGLETLERQADELARTNAALEEFAHVVSHDLKAPLRGISYLSKWIGEDCREILPEESRAHLALLEERTRRMGRLIDGVLAYSRAARRRSPERIDAEAVVAEVIDSLGPLDTASVRIEGELPTIRYDRTQLMQVFQNLIGNAVQHLGKPSGEVVVSCQERADAYEFVVRDDGVGIPESQRERIFRMFHTLDPSNETTGVGLCIVKKIVEGNGGVISVGSGDGTGASFRFRVPKA
jgi:signal transduction histidine kinase